MEQYSVLEIAEFFLSKSEMTPKKLQKICYYAEAWSCALLGSHLMNDTEFEAWIHGPVSPVLYDKYKIYGWSEIPKTINRFYEFSESVLDLLESVWYTYGDKSANELEVLTHLEEPWKEARKGYESQDPSNEKISRTIMKDYYLSIYEEE